MRSKSCPSLNIPSSPAASSRENSPRYSALFDTSPTSADIPQSSSRTDNGTLDTCSEGSCSGMAEPVNSFPASSARQTTLEQSRPHTEYPNMASSQSIEIPLLSSARNDTARDWDSQTSSGVSIPVHSDTLEGDHVWASEYSPFSDTSPISAGFRQSPSPWTDNGTSDTCGEASMSDLSVLLDGTHDFFGHSSLFHLDNYNPNSDIFLTDGDLGDPPHLGQASDSIYRYPSLVPSRNEGFSPCSGTAEAVDPFPASSCARQITLKQEEVDLPSGYQCDESTSFLAAPKVIFPKHEDEATMYPQPCSVQGRAPAINFHRSPQRCASFQESIGGNGPMIRPVGSDALLHAPMRRRERNPSYFCPYQGCGASFTAKHNLKNHVNSHQGVRPFTCNGCHRSFGTKHVLKRHTNMCGYYRQLRGTSSDDGAN